jgi:glycerol uptake facilitator-like aquaporin
MLAVLVTMLAPISDAHLNPAVTLTLLLRREIAMGDAIFYVLAQLIGAIFGVPEHTLCSACL